MSETRRNTAAAAVEADAVHTAAAAPMADTRRRAAAANRRRRAAIDAGGVKAGKLPAAAADQRAAGLAASFADAAAIELADGIKAGAVKARRDRAASIIATNTALGYTADEWYVMPDDTDPDGNPLDARDVIADVRPGTAHRYAPPSARLSGDDLLRIAAERAHTAARMTSGALDADDVRQAVALKLLEKFSPADTAAAPTRRAPDSREVRRMLRTIDRLLDRAAAPRHIDRCDLVEASTGTLPRWDAIDAVGLADPDADVTSRRRKWKGYAAQAALNFARDEHDRTKLNTAADWTDAGEDAPTAQQLAAAAADTAAAQIAEAVEKVDQDTLNGYAQTAPGGALRKAERDALLVELAGITRAQLAAARGVDQESAKKSAQRGRKALVARIDSLDTLREWVRHGRAAATDDLDRCAAWVADFQRIAAPRHDAPASVRLAWPDRIADPASDPYGPAWPASVTCDHPAKGIAAASPLMPRYALLQAGNDRCREGATCTLPTAADRAALAAITAHTALVAIPAAPIPGHTIPTAPRSVTTAAWTAAHNTAHRQRTAAAMDTAAASITDTDPHKRACRIARARWTAAQTAAPASKSLASFIAAMTA